MAWGTAASFVALYMHRARPRRSSKVSSASSRAELLRPREMLIPTQSASTESSTALRSPESRTQPMVPLASTTVSKQRSERRIAVRLPLKVRGRDAHGFPFEEDTSSENLCRNGAAFVTRFDVAIGSDLEIRIPLSQFGSRRPGSSALSRSADADFSTHGRVVHVVESKSEGEKLVGVQFTGPR